MSTLPPGKKIVNRHVINKDETLCTFAFVYNPENGMFAYPVEVITSSDPEEKNKNIAPVKIRDLVIKRGGKYEYYDNDGLHHYKYYPVDGIVPSEYEYYDKDGIIVFPQESLKNRYISQIHKYTDGILTLPEKVRLEGGSKRKSKYQRRKKSKSQRRKKSIKRRH
jgi:hypothetical protein